MTQQRNIFEDIVGDLIERTLGLRFDICKCPICRKKMLSMVVDKFPVLTIDHQDPQYREFFFETTNKYFKDLVEEIRKVADYISKNPVHEVEEDREEGFNRLLTKIYQARGLDFSQYHRNILKRRVALRLMAHKLNSYSEYLTVLADNPDEYEKLFEILTINVSEFFRDLHIWPAIKDL